MAIWIKAPQDVDVLTVLKIRDVEKVDVLQKPDLDSFTIKFQPSGVELIADWLGHDK